MALERFEGGMPPDAGNSSGSVVTSYRELGKWMFTSVGVIFAALVGAIAFAGLGKLDVSSAVFVWASLAALVTLLSIGYIAWRFAKVLEPFPLTKKEFEAAQASGAVKDMLDSFVPTYFQSYTDWLTRYGSFQRRYDQAEAGLNANPSNPAAKAALKELEDEKTHLLEGRAQVGDVLMYAEVSRRYREALSSLVLGGVLAIFGAIAFNVLTAKPAPISGSAPFAQPTLVEFTPNAVTKAVLQTVLGRDCSVERLRLARLGKGDYGTEYVSLPSNTCALKRLLLADDAGSFVAPTGK
jgi:hypothetical protein